MANKNYNSDFDIPLSIIFIACIFCFPLGIALLIIRSLFGTKSSYSVSASNRNRKVNGYGANAHNRKRSKSNRSKSSVLLKALSVLSLVFAGFSFICAISTFDFLTINLIISLFYIAAILGIFSLCLFVSSRFIDKRNSRFSRIRAIIGDRDSLNLNKLATASNSSLKKVIKDLQNMIDSGEFGSSAYIDLGANNFMRTPYAQPDVSGGPDFKETYGDPSRTDRKKSRGQAEEDGSPKTEQDNFNKIISDIKQLNYEIKDEAVSERIDKIEYHTKHIFDYVTDHPEAMPQIRTFMNYYLPTTLKLLESYKRIERVGVAGENMKKSKENIESILDLLVVGFEQQVDQLFKNECIDISSDISVLETMMQKDGLSAKNDFDIKSYDKYSDDVSDSGAAAQSSEN